MPTNKLHPSTRCVAYVEHKKCVLRTDIKTIGFARAHSFVSTKDFVTKTETKYKKYDGYTSHLHIPEKKITNDPERLKTYIETNSKYRHTSHTFICGRAGLQAYECGGTLHAHERIAWRAGSFFSTISFISTQSVCYEMDASSYEFTLYACMSVSSSLDFNF